jgi:hypothetical protein
MQEDLVARRWLFDLLRRLMGFLMEGRRGLIVVGLRRAPVRALLVVFRRIVVVVCVELVCVSSSLSSSGFLLIMVDQGRL